MKSNALIVATVLALALVACNKPGKKEEKACSNVVKLLFKEKADLAKKAFGSEDKGKKLCAAAGKTVEELIQCVLDNGKEKEIEECAKKSAMGFVASQGEDLAKLLALGQDPDLLALLGPASMIMGRKKHHKKDYAPRRLEEPKKPIVMPTPKTGQTVVVLKDRAVVVDKILAAWSDDWTLRVYALAKCPQFDCTHINRWGNIDRDKIKAICPEYGNFGVELKSHWGIRMRPGVWYYRKTDNEPVEAKPEVSEPSKKKWSWFGKGGTIQIVSLTDQSVGINANFSDSSGNVYKSHYTASICPPTKRPKALIVTELMPPPHKPLLPKAKLEEMKPKMPAEWAAEFEWVAWFPRDGSITWHLKKKATKETVLSISIDDKRNVLYTRSNRREKLFGKYPFTRYDHGWMWTYVGNFNIDVSTTSYKDARFKKNAVLEQMFQSLDLGQFEKL